MRLLGDSLQYAWINGVAYKVKDPNSLTLISRPSPKVGPPDGRCYYWPETLVVCFEVMEASVGLTFHFSDDPWRTPMRGDSRLTFANIKRANELGQPFNEFWHGGFTNNPEMRGTGTGDYYFGWMFQDGAKWMRWVDRYGQPAQKLLVPRAWVPALQEKWGTFPYPER